MKYKVGDRVKIKSWEQMAEEYGVNKDKIGMKYIDTPCYRFLKEMKIYCGDIMEIKYVCPNNTYWMKKSNYVWTDEMIECKVDFRNEYEEKHPIFCKGLSDAKYKVGDLVLVKPWVQMEEEYGRNEDDIATPIIPVNVSMKKYCGSIATIQAIRMHPIEEVYTYRMKENFCGFRWTEYMLMPFDDRKMIVDDLKLGSIIVWKDNSRSLLVEMFGNKKLLNENNRIKPLDYSPTDHLYDIAEIKEVIESFPEDDSSESIFTRFRYKTLWRRSVNETLRQTEKELEDLFGYPFKVNVDE